MKFENANLPNEFVRSDLAHVREAWTHFSTHFYISRCSAVSPVLRAFFTISARSPVSKTYVGEKERGREGEPAAGREKWQVYLLGAAKRAKSSFSFFSTARSVSVIKYFVSNKGLRLHGEDVLNITVTCKKHLN